jgi:hypothetical protein
MKKVLCLLSIALFVAVGSGAAFAQACLQAYTGSAQGLGSGEDEAECFTTNYFANNTTAGAPDGTLRYTEHYGGLLASGTKLCANIYVFAADQQPTECCSCLITPNGLVTTSVKNQLTKNPLTGIVPPDGVVQIVSSLVPPGGCDPTFGAVAGTQGILIPQAPFPEVDSWLTHIQNKVGTAFPITETEGVEELLTLGEFEDLALDCAFVQEFGSGQGTCSCGTER